MIRYRIDRERQLIELTGSGSVTAAELLAYQDQVRADPDFDSGFAVLADFSAADGALLDVAGLRTVAANPPPGVAAPRAIVVADDVAFGLGRMFEAYSEFARDTEMVRTFRDRESALRWIEEARRG